MIKGIIENFKPASHDTVLVDFQLQSDMRWQHLQELKELLEDEGYEEDALALSKILDGDEIHERLLQKLCEKTDSHPVHNRG